MVYEDQDSQMPWLAAFALLMLPGQPVAAQTPACEQLARQLLQQLEAGPTASIEPTAREQRRSLRARGCDPRSTGYDVEVEELKLNRELEAIPEGKEGFRLDRLLELRY